LVSSAPPKVLSVSTYTKEVSIFGDQYTIGYFEVDFDQDLYVYKGIPVCDPICTADLDCPPCDYTDPDVCAGMYDDASLDCPCFSYLCDIPQVFPGRSTLTRTLESGPALWRVERNASDSCEALVFRVQRNISNAAYIQVDQPVWYTNIFRPDVVGNRYQAICPSIWSPAMTVGNTLWLPNSPEPDRDYVTFELQKRNVSEQPIDYNCVAPAELNATIWGDPWYADQHICFPMNGYGNWDGEFDLGVYGLPMRWVVPLKSGECQTFHLGFWGSLEKLFISYDNPWIEADQSDFYNNGSFFFNPGRYSDSTAEGQDEFVMTRCFPAGEEHYLYITAFVYGYLEMWIQDSKDWMDLIPFTDVSQTAFPHDFNNGFTILCGDKTFTNSHDYVQDFAPWDEGISNTRMLFPSESPNYFYPVISTFYQDSRFAIPTLPEQPLIPKRIVVAMLLDWDLVVQSNFERKNGPYIPIKHQFLDKSEFGSCRIEFHGNFGNSQWEAVVGKPDDSVYNQKNTTCDANAFNQVKAKIAKNLAIVEDSSDVTSILDLSFELDYLASSDPYYFCAEKFSKYYQTSVDSTSRAITTPTDGCIYEWGTEEFAQDDCCNFTLSYLEACKIKNKTVDIPTVSGISADTDSCAIPDCARLSALNLGQENIRAERPDGCQEKVALLDPFSNGRLAPYLSCRRKFFYYFANYGLPCDHDIDCPNGGSCSTYRGGVEARGECLYQVDSQLDQFLNCMFTDMSAYVITQIQQSIGAANNTPQEWKRALAIDGCNDPSGFFIGAIQRLMTLDFGCPFDGLMELDTLDPVTSFSCSGVSQSVVPYEESCALQFCNWDSTLNSSACLDPINGDSFCGLCENGQECWDLTYAAEVPFDEDSCNKAILCALNNGTYILTNTTDECENIFSCDLTCDGDECLNQGDCTDERYGYCTDQGHYGPGDLSYFTAEGGTCVVEVVNPLPYSQNPICYGYNLQQEATGVCFWPTPAADCTTSKYAEYQEEEFITKSATWYPFAESKAFCYTWPKICKGVKDAGDTQIQDNAIWGLTDEECSARGGYLDNLWEWKTGRWLGGQARTLNWTDRVYKTRMEPGKMFDFVSLSKWVNAAIRAEYGLLLQGSLFCQYASSSEHINRLVCNCVGQEDNCYNTSIGTADIGALCAGHATYFSSPPFLLQFTDYSAGYIGCHNVLMSPRSMIEFKDSQKPSLANALISYGEDIKWSSDRNGNYAIFAKVLTDGLRLEFNGTIGNVTLSADFNQQRLDYLSETFTVLDIGVRRTMDNKLVVPLYSKVTVTKTGFVGVIPELETNATYYFIQRRAGDWTILPREVFSGGELAYLAVILTMYCFGLIGCVGKLIAFFWLNGIHWDRLLFVLGTLTTFFIFRVVLFSLVLSNGLIDSTSPAPGYVLIEFPILLYFIFVSNYIMLWFFIRKDTKKLKSYKKLIQSANIGIVTLNAFVFIIFIICIILYETIVQDPYFICGGALVVFDSNTAFIILMVYRAIFSFIEIAFGVCLLYAGITFVKLLKSMDHVPIAVVYRTQAIALFGGFGLIGQGIYLLVVVATRTEQSLYLSLSILIVVEIIPTWVFLVTCEVKKISSLATASRSTRSKTQDAGEGVSVTLKSPGKSKTITVGQQ